MNVQNINNNLIEYLISLLSLPDDCIMDPDSLTGVYSSVDPPNITTAYELMRFMDEMPGGFFIYHADGDEDIIYANKALLRIFRCDTMQEFKELTGNSFKGIVYYEDLEAVEKSIKEQIASSKYDLDYVEYRIAAKDGSIHWVEDYGHFIRSRYAGDVFYVFVSDATEKKKELLDEKEALLSEKLLNEKKLLKLVEKYSKEKKVINQEYLRRLEVIKGLSVNYESILYVDLDADIVLPYRLSNRAGKQFKKDFSAREFMLFITEYINTWVHPEDRDSVIQATSPGYIRERLSAAKTYYINYRILKDENLQYLQLRIVNVGKGRHISQIVMGYKSIDDEVLLEMEQKQMLEEALQSAKLAIVAKSAFLSNMSHDMRTPLNAVFGYSELARNHVNEPEAVLEYLNKINASAKQLLNLINRVLEIAWAESNDTRVVETECNICAIVQDVYRSMQPNAKEKNIDFSMDLGGLSHYEIYGDQDKLHQFLRNLVSNAIKYTNNGGRVDIIVNEAKEISEDFFEYHFTVKDNGIGISKDFIENIFKPFEREKNTTLSGIHGSGLGLTITKNLVEMMGGTIDVESEVGKGSTFTVTLRLRIQNENVLPEDSTTDVLSRLLDQKILLVEDNEINLEIETELLYELGLTLETASDGKAAVERIASSKPGEFALILMDIQMPVMNGLQAAAAIRRLEDPALAGIPIIALSANAFESDKRASLESGMNAHITKPIDIPFLLETMAKVLQSHTGN